MADTYKDIFSALGRFDPTQSPRSKRGAFTFDHKGIYATIYGFEPYLLNPLIKRSS